MTALINQSFVLKFRTQLVRARSGAATVVDDIAHGLFEITHNSFALLGLGVVFAVIALTARPDLREAGELQLMTWLEERHDAGNGVAEAEADEPPVIVSSKPAKLPVQQAAVASWLSKKYAVAPEPLGVLVAQAFEIGHRVKLDPTLILAIMAIESGFNPFAQSPVGAQGLMQVMTRVHHDKYQNFGGKLAAFDPVTNLQVGVKVLQDCISRAGSIEGGLKHYVGAANFQSDGGYAAKVMAEHGRLIEVVGGKRPAPVRVAAAPAVVVTAAAPARRHSAAPGDDSKAFSQTAQVNPADQLDQVSQLNRD